MADIASILLPGPAPEGDRWRWGTVTGADPLTVRLDGESASLAATPQALGGNLQVGDRVWCQLHGRRVVVFPQLETVRESVHLGTRDLNDVTEPGFYHQPSNSNATAARNYPPDLLAGFLEVMAIPNRAHVYQRFTQYRHTVLPAVTWTRVLTGGQWSPWAVIGDLPLPDPILLGGAAVNAITATSWANLPAGDVMTTLSLPRPCIVTLEYGAWFAKGTTNDLRCGVFVTGSTSVGASTPNWGAVLWSGGDNSVDTQHAASKTVRLNAGAHTIRLQAYVNTGTANVNYPYLIVTPKRWTT